MKIIKVTIGRTTYRLFEITVFKGTSHEQTLCVAEEKLNRKVERTIREEQYHKVEDIDRMYGYWVPQDIADDELETEIVDSIESVMREDLGLIDNDI